MEKINIAELLKDCPNGMELDCTVFNGKICFEGFDHNNSAYPIKISVNLVNIEHLNIYGQYNTRDYAKCIIFPKGKTTWEGFQRPFKDGDIVVYDNPYRDNLQVFIFKDKKENNTLSLCYLMLDGDELDLEEGMYYITRLATEEEKQKLFDAIKANGYKWNAETKTLEKLVTIFKVGDKIKLKNEYAKKYDDFNTREITEIEHSHYILDDKETMPLSNQYLYELVPVEPKFKVGDRIRSKKDAPINISGVLITEVNKYSYNGVIGDTTNTAHINFKYQDLYELDTNKFDINTLKPFDKVLVRDNDKQTWCISFFSHCNGLEYYKYSCINGSGYAQCIPYESNEHLLGTTNDCDDFYKTWEA